MRTRTLLLLAVLCLPAIASAATGRYYKMVRTEDAASFRTGTVLRPRFSKSLLEQKYAVTLRGRNTYAGGDTEQLFVDTLARLRREGLVPRSSPGRTEGVFVTADLDRFPLFRDDPQRSKVTLEPANPARVATYDRRQFLVALRALERARSARGAEKQRLVARAERAAERYYTGGVDLSDPKAEPETLLGGGGRVVRIQLRK